MKKRIVALLLTAAMAVGLVACGSSSDTASDTTTNDTDKDAAAVEASVDLTDKANIDNTVERESINIAWQDATTLAPWGTNNDTPGNYEVYEMLYECTSDGERYGVLADTSKGDFEPGCDHEDGTGVYTVYIYDYIKDHAGNA
jgi:hypothetical protein